MQIRSTDLRHSIALQSATSVTDPDGHPSRTWSTYATVYARIWTLQGREQVLAQQNQTVLSHDFTIHYRSDVTASHRLMFGSRVFDIEYVINVGEMNRWLTLRCTEVA